MNKEAKVNLLKAINEGKIKVGEIADYMVTMGMIDTHAVVWIEIKPGVYQDDEGHLLNEGEPIPRLYQSQANVKVRLFHNDGTPVPALASSEDEINC